MSRVRVYTERDKHPIKGSKVKYASLEDRRQLSTPGLDFVGFPSNAMAANVYIKDLPEHSSNRRRASFVIHQVLNRSCEVWTALKADIVPKMCFSS